MVASVSAWAKPSAWALDAEEHESAMAVAKDRDDDVFSSVASQQQDFPSLAAAASSTSKKKKKAQALTLAEFTTGKPVSHGAGGRPLSSSSNGLTRDEFLILPTGPRERSAEELERSSSRGFGYSSYGGARGRASVSGEESGPTRWDSSRDSDDPRRDGFGGAGGGSNRDLLPSRADEIDDWGAAKKSVALERREMGGGGSFFDSQSRADESDRWISNKSTAPPAEGRRIGGGGGGFEMFKREGSNSGGADSETWGRKKDFGDSDTWRREDEIGSGGRRRLVLQPRSLPLSNGEQVQGKQDEGSTTEKKSRGSNPFGQARPREEVLADKGQDWKQIDEKLEASKIQDAQLERSLDKRGFGVANGAGRSPVLRGISMGITNKISTAMQA
ncbi:Eukaryotic translation initiation factor 4B [Musa troglodytarum]|uniref:Eukaryotic translation initiation factor 4B n=1 Tax=Musa troglodytarum TaxID=320322 RepID=A0A9E7FTW1_9LILI|nr:Eukaryotic translation initiation factor 4B [Musa troglodytarum]